MKNYIKIVIIFIARYVLRIFYVFPIKKNKILFSAHEGNSYNCNPKYIFEYMYEHWEPPYDYVWCLNNKKLLPSKFHAKCVKYLSFSHLYHLLTAKIIINNLEIEPIIPKRRKQIFINTWHGGGAYKNVNHTSDTVSKSGMLCKYYMGEKRGKMTNYILSSCHEFTKTHSAIFHVNQSRFLPIGMPRNDVFFSSSKELIKEKIIDLYHIPSNKIIILYAPTFRGLFRHPNYFNSLINPESVCLTIEKRFGKEAIMLYRHHHALNGMKLKNVIDVSDYQDMQELLLTADILITDYSSSMWDFSLTYKPGFLFTPDLEDYKKNIGFHTPIERWPYPYAQTMEELCMLIASYDTETAKQKIKKHLSELSSYEIGNATESICRIIKDQL